MNTQATQSAKSTKSAQSKRTKSTPHSHRYTLRVPIVDTSVTEWWAEQDDPSASVRSLIRDEIMRNGFTDTVNRPVAQLPRRGRPPQDGLVSEQDGVAETVLPENKVSTPSTVQPEDEPKEKLQPKPSVESQLAPKRRLNTPSPRREASPVRPAAEHAPNKRESDPVSTDTPAQIDMADIFGHGS